MAGLIIAPLSVLTFVKITVPMLTSILGDASRLIYIEYTQAYNSLVEQIPAIKNAMGDMSPFRAGIILFNIPLVALKYIVCAFLSSIGYLLFKDF